MHKELDHHSLINEIITSVLSSRFLSTCNLDVIDKDAIAGVIHQFVCIVASVPDDASMTPGDGDIAHMACRTKNIVRLAAIPSYYGGDCLKANTERKLSSKARTVCETTMCKGASNST